MPTPNQRPIPWDIYEEHLSEAAWLWGEREAALDSAAYSIADVAAGPEERLLAHLDGLVLGGAPVANRLLIPSLSSDDPGQIAAAAWALVQAEDADHQDKVIEALGSAEPPARAAIGRALLLSPKVDISRLIPLWDTCSPAVRALMLELFTPREPAWVRERIQAALRSGNLALVAAAVRTIRILHDELFRDHLQLAIQIEDPVVWREAIGAGLAMGVKMAWDVCRAVADAKGEAGRFPLALLATSPDPNDRAFVRGKVADPEVAPHALWALGFSGEVESAELILQSMETEKTGKVAGEAFSAITGLVIDGPWRKPGEARSPEVEEVGLDDPPPAVRSEDALPEPEIQAVRKWWDRERSRFKSPVRYLYGQPRTEDNLRVALLCAPTWRREVLALELLGSKAGPPKVDLKGWAKEQIKQLRSD